jgi:predicted NUDIX family NTP pyrophosphohydrolase
MNTVEPMKKTSAGLLLFRDGGHGLEILLVHPGGPFWAKKDAGAWFVPKGELNQGEEPLDCAKREFLEETGFAPQGPFLPLGSVQQKSGKTIHAWAVRGDFDPAKLRSNTFELEWPPRSGKLAQFPEVDRAAFFTEAEARERMHPAEFPFVERLRKLIDDDTRK